MKFLETISSPKIYDCLHRYGRMGVTELAKATPVETGETSQSWGYQVNHKPGVYYSISWFNTHREDDVNIAVILQYGHGTGTGAYVKGIDYINPAMRPIFDNIADEVWNEVRNA